ncbi:MAG: type II secretion system protein N [Planctomycetota bacterium]
MYIRKVLFAFKLALVLVLSFVFLRTVIMPQNPVEMFQPSSAVGTDNLITEGAEDMIENSVEDYSVLVQQNIFGVTDITNVEEKSPEVDEFDDVVTLVGEELNLELIGTVCGNTSVSRAIIKNNKNNQLGMYKTGQNIAGARIKSIKENAVILIHKGQRKMLTLNRIGVNDTKNEQMLSLSAISETGKVVNPALPVQQPAEEIPTKIVHIESMLNEAAIEPFLVDGLVEGLRISDLDKIPMAKAFGLKDGDIIRHVNGHRLTSKQQAFQVFKKAKSEAVLSLDLLSDGETRELSFNLQ